MAQVSADHTDAGSWLVVTEGDLPVLGAYLPPDAARGTLITLLWDGHLRPEPIVDFCRAAAAMFRPAEGAADLRGRAFASGRAYHFDGDAWLAATDVGNPAFLRLECLETILRPQGLDGFVLWGRPPDGNLDPDDDEENLGVQLRAVRLPALERQLVPLIAKTQARDLGAALVLEALRELERYLRPRETPQAAAA